MTSDTGALIADFRAGRRSAEAIVRAALAQLHAWHGLGAVTWIDESAALANARRLDARRARGDGLGRLAGLPFLAKDNIDTAGYPTTAGTQTLRDLRPNSDAAVVDELLRQGALLLGKTNMHELAAGGTTNNPTYGATRNPYAWDRVPGGSSGGSGAAVAARIAPIALGTDTAGSVRIPAAYCGVAGLRPTVLSRDDKAYASDGLVPFSWDLDTVGPIARTAADLALFDGLLRNYAPHAVPRLSDLRIGVPRDYYWDDLDPEISRVALAAVDNLRRHGVTVVDVDVSGYVGDAAEGFGVLCFDGGLRGDIPEYMARYGLSAGRVLAELRARDVRRLVERAMAAPAGDLERARRQRTTVRVRYVALFGEHRLGAMLFPTVAALPPRIETAGDPADHTTSIRGKELSTNYLMIRNTSTTSYLGAPGLSIPAGVTATGLPVGMELDGLPGRDAALLGIGCAVEQAWGTLEPPRRRT